MNIMDDNKILSDVSKAVTEEATSFEIDVKPQNKTHTFLQKIRLKPTKKKYLIRPLTLGTMARLSRLANLLQIKDLTKENFREINYDLAENSGGSLAEMIALAVTNSREYPDNKLISFLLYNLTAKELLTAVQIVLVQMDTQNFISTIASIRSLNILEKREKENDKSEASPLVPGNK